MYKFIINVCTYIYPYEICVLYLNTEYIYIHICIPYCLLLLLPEAWCPLSHACIAGWLVWTTPGRPKVGPGGTALQLFDAKSPGMYVGEGSECLALVKHCELESIKQVDRDISDLKKLRRDLMSKPARIGNKV